ncbi:hypothetical protein Ancab_010931 [Ancistrocladus abbreviatus]
MDIPLDQCWKHRHHIGTASHPVSLVPPLFVNKMLKPIVTESLLSSIAFPASVHQEFELLDMFKIIEWLSATFEYYPVKYPSFESCITKISPD